MQSHQNLSILRMVTFLSLGIVLYYAPSSFFGERQYKILVNEHVENERKIKRLDSLTSKLQGKPQETEEDIVKLVDYENEKLLLYDRRGQSQEKLKIGQSVLNKRLLKLYCGSGVLFVSLLVYLFLYLKRKRALAIGEQKS